MFNRVLTDSVADLSKSPLRTSANPRFGPRLLVRDLHPLFAKDQQTPQNRKEARADTKRYRKDKCQMLSSVLVRKHASSIGVWIHNFVALGEARLRRSSVQKTL